jgi:hypothetical protein
MHRSNRAPIRSSRRHGYRAALDSDDVTSEPSATATMSKAKGRSQ